MANITKLEELKVDKIEIKNTEVHNGAETEGTVTLKLDRISGECWGGYSWDLLFPRLGNEQGNNVIVTPQYLTDKVYITEPYLLSTLFSQTDNGLGLPCKQYDAKIYLEMHGAPFRYILRDGGPGGEYTFAFEDDNYQTGVYGGTVATREWVGSNLNNYVSIINEEMGNPQEVNAKVFVGSDMPVMFYVSGDINSKVLIQGNGITARSAVSQLVNGSSSYSYGRLNSDGLSVKDANPNAYGETKYSYEGFSYFDLGGNTGTPLDMPKEHKILFPLSEHTGTSTEEMIATREWVNAQGFGGGGGSIDTSYLLGWDPEIREIFDLGHGSWTSGSTTWYESEECDDNSAEQFVHISPLGPAYNGNPDSDFYIMARHSENDFLGLSPWGVYIHTNEQDSVTLTPYFITVWHDDPQRSGEAEAFNFYFPIDINHDSGTYTLATEEYVNNRLNNVPKIYATESGTTTVGTLRVYTDSDGYLHIKTS